MLKRNTKSRLVRIVLYRVVAFFFFLILFNLLFPDLSWFRRNRIINPILQNKGPNVSKIESMLSESRIAFSYITLKSDYFDIRLADGEVVYMPVNKDLKIQTSSLQAILKELTINGKEFKKIDFRFDKPVISF